MIVIDSDQITNILSSSSTFQEALKSWNAYCNSTLNTFKPVSLDTAIQILQNRKAKINNQPIPTGEIKEDEETKKVFELMLDFSEGIKTLYTQFDGILTHCTSISPEKMGDSIKVSKNTQFYHTEVGDWIFASSIPIDGTNLFAIRKSREGLFSITPGVFVLGENHIQVTKTPQGDVRAILDSPNYIYKIKPNNFSPTVNLMRGKNNTPRLVFHGEWTSTKNLDLTNPEFFLSVEELSDVTPAVQKYQIFTAAQMPKSLDELIPRQLYLADESSRINVLLKELRNGNLRWINRRDWNKCPNRISSIFVFWNE